jgi:hypothetical protein
VENLWVMKEGRNKEENKARKVKKGWKGLRFKQRI